ncbi:MULTISPECIES: type I polyketide synthase [Streptomyces]|nr:type I polyketide synthase [Streptomyces canarius]
MSVQGSGAAQNQAGDPQQAELVRRLLLEKYEPIALVGAGVRLPGGSNSLDELTEFLREGGTATVPVPSDRWDNEELSKLGQPVPQAGGFLDAIDLFDARFFNISPKGAAWIDPQQRLLMETAWEALESANIDPATLRHGNGGVYIGASNIDYAMELDGIAMRDLDGSVAPGVTHAGLCGRLSYFLGWRGPSITIDTACSASLVALHYAVEGLRRRECDIALCGGVNVIHHPRTNVLFADLEALSPDGRCKTFDDSADGYGRAEGCGVLVLKRMSDAKRDGDRVLALIRGTAVGQDGESAGLYVPNGSAQEHVMRRALAAAALEPGHIQFVEAHGTGTPLGDPIELGAISEVFRDSHTPTAPVVVSSHKANIGHMEPAAGVGGVLKTVAQLRDGSYFPQANFDTPSSRIPWTAYPVDVPTSNRPWQAGTRRALVNSFGFTGTIAAAVVEQAPPSAEPGPRPGDGDRHVFTLSAKSAASLRHQLDRYQKLLDQRPDLDVGDICYTANVGRAHFAHRVSGVVRDREDLTALLADRLVRLSGEQGDAGDISRKVAFLFAGQGAQYAGMGAGLYRRYARFREQVDEIDALFEPYLGQSLKAIMLGDDGDPQEINRTRWAQPTLFMLEYALAQLWLSWGVRPSVMIGHSIGEVVAAAVAGLFSLPDAVRLVAARARLMDSVSAPGGMLAVRVAADEVAPLLEAHPDLAIAARNAPTQCVLSGARASLDALKDELVRRKVHVTELSVSHAFHSPLMEEITEAFAAELADIEFHEPQLSFVSNVTGEMARWRQVSRPEYWVRHITAPVDFLGGMRTVERRGNHAFIEIGPARTLTALAKRSAKAAEHQVWLPSLRKGAEDDEALLHAVAGLYEVGLSFGWRDFHGPATDRRKVDLPTYAFDRRRYWLPTDRHRHLADSEPSPQAVPDVPAPRTASVTPQDLAGLTSEEREAALVVLVREHLAITLGFAHATEVPATAAFSELGMDSLAAVELRDGLQSALSITLPVSAVFDHPTPRLLAAFLGERFDGGGAES